MHRRSARCNHIVNGPPINLLGCVERQQAVPASETRCAGHPSVRPLTGRRLAARVSKMLAAWRMLKARFDDAASAFTALSPLVRNLPPPDIRLIVPNGCSTVHHRAGRAHPRRPLSWLRRQEGAAGCRRRPSRWRDGRARTPGGSNCGKPMGKAAGGRRSVYRNGTGPGGPPDRPAGRACLPGRPLAIAQPECLSEHHEAGDRRFDRRGCHEASRYRGCLTPSERCGIQCRSMGCRQRRAARCLTEGNQRFSAHGRRLSGESRLTGIMRSIAGPTFRHNSGSFQETVKLQAVAESARKQPNTKCHRVDYITRCARTIPLVRGDGPIAAGYIGQSSNLHKSNAARQSTLSDARCVHGLGRPKPRKFAPATYTLSRGREQPQFLRWSVCNIFDPRTKTILAYRASAPFRIGNTR